MKFNQIVAIDHTRLKDWAWPELQKYSEKPIQIFDDQPGSEEEIIQRIGEADAVLVSWRTFLSKQIIKSCPNLKYIGMCCSLYDESSANVNIKAARELGIVVKGVRDYGDEGVVEFVFSELIRLFKGIGPHQWIEEPRELKGKTLGIIGMGVTGSMVAAAGLAFGMKVQYFSRTKKPNWDAKGVPWQPLHTLLSESQVISTHLPRNTFILGEKEFAVMQADAIWINTSLGPTYELEALKRWLSKGTNNYLILDADGLENSWYSLKDSPRILLTRIQSGSTFEAKDRLTQKALTNLMEFVERGPE